MSVDAVLRGEARFAIAHEDALAFARSLPDESVDALVTDPPAGIAFMGKAWDGDKGGRNAWVAWLAEILRECHRALKPGGHALVWALPRTSHWTATAVEDAGFEVRDVVVHLFGTGFPKSLDVSKALDRSAGIWRGRAGAVTIADQPSKGTEYARTEKGGPVTAAAAAAAGFGTALKPASEHWILARKPLTGTVARTFVEHGTGALNIDACRIAGPPSKGGDGGASLGYGSSANTDRRIDRSCVAGRWPANVVLSHEPECREECVEHCAVAALDAQSGTLTSGSSDGFVGEKFSSVAMGVKRSEIRPEVVYADSGGASRFFFCAKPSTAERELGLGHRKRGKARSALNAKNGTGERLDGAVTADRANVHPTVKSIALMRWLCRLVTPPGGVVLDVFTGSGTTAVACSQEGLRFIGCEREAEYAAIARDRLVGDAPLLNASAGVTR